MPGLVHTNGREVLFGRRYARGYHALSYHTKSGDVLFGVRHALGYRARSYQPLVFSLARAMPVVATPLVTVLNAAMFASTHTM